MLSSVIRFVRLPLALLALWTIFRFSVGVSGVPYAPRGNAMFSVFGLSIISSIYFGALSVRTGGFSWKGTILVGVVIGFCTQSLIFIATLISYVGGFENSYFIHWDALNVPEGTVVSMTTAMLKRAAGLFFGSLFPAIAALVGRLLNGLAPKSAA